MDFYNSVFLKYRQIFIGKFFVVFITSFLLSSFVSAENLIEISECETEMLKAFSKADELLNENISDYLNLPDVSGVAKSQQLDSYDRTYQCHTQAICSSLLAPTSSAPFAGGFKKCDLKESNNSVSFQEEFGVDFSSCAPTLIEHFNRLSGRCSSFADQKNTLARNTISSQFVDEVHLQNKSLLAAKILDIRKKMAVLIEKTRFLSVNFTNTINDINCTNASPSGFN